MNKTEEDYSTENNGGMKPCPDCTQEKEYVDVDRGLGFEKVWITEERFMIKPCDTCDGFGFVPENGSGGNGGEVYEE
jgi:hypothetical protein